jgi:hypothetical protein
MTANIKYSRERKLSLLFIAKLFFFFLLLLLAHKDEDNSSSSSSSFTFFILGKDKFLHASS